ncbi:HNH endonuclease [Pseudarthrobacter sp. NIBRBAC000502772]|uniref:HNH endonuclease family protein n=1 Tax=Pseudarthrobacter sp. NIBRBAC000502772 TaxID=2590775 RepID=UPI0011324AF6|nr:HNH endonuclease family protein [Pseudarthrobacter sp. NIBRBAC000502772]QDG67395.1 HNH endonuclease [Pseudarthrobacter sp. NIBRBAC000502772]
MTVSWRAYRRARRRSRQAWALLAVLAVSAVGSAGWFFTAGQFAAAEPAIAGPREAPVFDGTWMKPVIPVHAVPQGSALTALERLSVKGRAPKDNYQREAFGQAWLDVDRNGCDTRNDILRRDLTAVGFTEGSKCKVVSGSIHEPYTGKAMEFRRGPESSKEIQIDHVVALSDAWQKGAQGLTPQQRQSLANDPINLIAADGPANQQKSASDAATWLPRNKNIRCHYVARQVSVKASYGLWVTQPEKDAMKRVLDSCPDQPTITAR